jgi:2-phospho-L-lactate guanylyltransferase
MPQGTVKHFDDASRSGTLLLDDTSEVSIDATSLEGSGIRFLRIGQRVRFDLVEEAGQATARSLRVVTL